MRTVQEVATSFMIGMLLVALMCFASVAATPTVTNLVFGISESVVAYWTPLLLSALWVLGPVALLAPIAWVVGPKHDFDAQRASSTWFGSMSTTIMTIVTYVGHVAAVAALYGYLTTGNTVSSSDPAIDGTTLAVPLDTWFTLIIAAFVVATRFSMETLVLFMEKKSPYLSLVSSVLAIIGAIVALIFAAFELSIVDATATTIFLWILLIVSIVLVPVQTYWILASSMYAFRSAKGQRLMNDEDYVK